jgi:hypothetical protein
VQNETRGAVCDRFLISRPSLRRPQRSFPYAGCSLSRGTFKIVLLFYYTTQFYEAFSDRRTHLGNLFVAIDNADMNNEVAPYMADESLVPNHVTHLVVLVLISSRVF